MEEYIKRSDVIKSIEELKKSPWCEDEYFFGDYLFGLKSVKREALETVVDLCVKTAQAEDVKKVVYGNWIKMNGKKCYWYACSKCGHDVPKDTLGNDWFSKWCPNCGTKMIYEREE